MNEAEKLSELGQIHYAVADARLALEHARLDERGLVTVVEILNGSWVLNFYKVSTKRGISQTDDVRMFAIVEDTDLVVEAF